MSDDPWTRRLPRSNLPLPGESLAGYLLNLSHRLDYPLNELAVRLGLKDRRPSLLDITWAITLPDEQRDRLAQAAGLTTDQIINLTAQRWGDTIILGPIARTDHGQRWMSLATTRYCPQCLGTRRTPHPVWDTAWQLPWTVACTRHQRLLLTHCPQCHTPVGEPGGRRFRSLVPNLATPVAHPAACSAIPTTDTKPCGYRLTEATAPPAHPPLIALQQRLNDAIDNPSTLHQSIGAHIASNQWLKDLRLVCEVIQVARHEPALADNPYRDEAVSHLRNLGRSPARGTCATNLRTQPATNTAVQAALLLAATQLTDGEGQPEHLNALTKAARLHHNGTVKSALRLSSPSEGLREALTHSKNRLTEPRRIRAYTRTPRTYGPQHVPAYLDTDTYLQHFPDIGLGGQLENPLRRYIPIALVRLSANLNPTQAGEYLGYTQNFTEAAIARASNAFDTIGHSELLKRTAQIADELETQPRINWAHRRSHFTDTWTVPDADWYQLQQTLLDARAARADTPWEQRRPAYAAWLWREVTHGDIRNAPMIQTVVNGRLCTDGRTKHISDITRRCAPIVHATVAALAQQYVAAIDMRA